MAAEGKQHTSAVMLGGVALSAVLCAAMPYLVWVAVRDNGRGRSAAAWWVSLAVTLSAAVGLLAGSWWWLPVAWFVLSVLAITHISVRVHRDKKAEAKALSAPDPWFTNRR